MEEVENEAVAAASYAPLVQQEKEQGFGKFKDSASLKKAYENLEAEFTKKSQRMKELEKAAAQVANSGGSEKAAEKEKTAPCYQSEDWPLRVAKFIEENKFAKDYAQNICAEILADEELARDKNALENAWARVTRREFRPVSDIAADLALLTQHAMNSTELKNKIIEDYVRAAQRKDFVPQLISGSAGGGGFTVTKKTIPTNFYEAKKQAEKLFS